MKLTRLSLILGSALTSTVMFQNCSDFSALSKASSGFKNSFSSPNALTATFTPGQGNRIGVNRQGDSVNFIDNSTGRIFIPRGPNFARLYYRQVHGPSYNNEMMWAHGLFDVARYNAADIESQLSQMQSSGYNYLRVFLTGEDSELGFGLSAPGVGAQYEANIIDFLRRAKNHNLLVVFGAGYDWNFWTPANYHSIVTSAPTPVNTTGINTVILNPAVGRAQGQFFADVLNGVRNGAPGENLLDQVFAIDLWNEIVGSMVDCPFGSGDTGLNYAFNGQTYAMNDPSRRQALLDDATVNWINTAGTIIKQADSGVLITTSVLTAHWVGATGFNGAMDFGRIASTSPLIPIHPAAIARSMADYIDIHIYNQNADFNDLANELAIEEVSRTSPFPKPLVAGEIGVMLNAHPDQNEARTFFRNLITTTASYQFSGWGFWSWDNTGTSEAGGTGTYSLVQNDGAMNAEFAPVAVDNYARNWGPGAFISGGAINYSNGDQFCTYQNYTDYERSGNTTATSHVAIQEPLLYAGFCVVN